MLEELGYEKSAVGVADLYKNVASILVIDEVDAALSSRIESQGIQPLVTDTIMSDPERAAHLAKVTLESLFLSKERRL
jgi:LPPG:FO 2-phospho-L-lactate transferase